MNMSSNICVSILKDVCLNICSYNKYSRELSQTPWLIDGERKSESSVEEHICGPLNKFILASEWRFSASGREDVDVRMLGTGRPFVVELINPRRVNFTHEQMKAAQVVIPASIAVPDGCFLETVLLGTVCNQDSST